MIVYSQILRCMIYYVVFTVKPTFSEVGFSFYKERAPRKVGVLGAVEIVVSKR